MEFYRKLDRSKGRKLTHPNFFEKSKNSFTKKKKAFTKNLIDWCLFYPKNGEWQCYLLFWKNPCLGKMCFLSYTVSYSDCTIFRLSQSLQGIKRYLRFFFAWKQSSSKVSSWDFFFWMGLASCASYPIMFQDFLSSIFLEGIDLSLRFFGWR